MFIYLVLRVRLFENPISLPHLTLSSGLSYRWHIIIYGGRQNSLENSGQNGTNLVEAAIANLSVAISNAVAAVFARFGERTTARVKSASASREKRGAGSVSTKSGEAQKVGRV